MTETNAAAPAKPARVTTRARKRRPDSRYEDLAEPFLARLAAGVSVLSACRDPDMPHWSSVQRWLRTEPGFAERFAAARELGGGIRRGGGIDTYDPEVGDAICERIALGEPLTRICQEPGMPSGGTVFGWLRRHEDFRDAYRLAREVQGHAMADRILEVIEEAEPATVALARLRADNLRWLAAKLAPGAFGPSPTAGRRKSAAPPPEQDDDWNEPNEPKMVVVKSFAPGPIVRLDLMNAYVDEGRLVEVYKQVRQSEIDRMREKDREGLAAPP